MNMFNNFIPCVFSTCELKKLFHFMTFRLLLYVSYCGDCCGWVYRVRIYMVYWSEFEINLLFCFSVDFTSIFFSSRCFCHSLSPSSNYSHLKPAYMSFVNKS